MLILACRDAGAATKAAGPPAPAASSPIQILPGTSSKEPVSIDADKLVYFDKEKKAIYSGNVVVVQGDTKMTCSVMTVFLEKTPTPGAAAPDPQQSGPAPGSGLTRLEATGPVTVISKTQVATGDNAIYDKLENRVQLIGHVTLSDGQNITKGDKLTYDLKTESGHDRDSRLQIRAGSRTISPERRRRIREAEIGASIGEFRGPIHATSESACERGSARPNSRDAEPVEMVWRESFPLAVALISRPGRRRPAGGARRASPRQRLSRANGRAGRQHFGAARRSGRLAWPERGGQDHGLLHDHGTCEAGQRRDRTRRP